MNSPLVSGSWGSSSARKTLSAAWTTCLIAALALWAGLWVWPEGARRAVPALQTSFDQVQAFLLRLTSDEASLGWILCPAVLVLAWASSLLLMFDRPPKWVRCQIAVTFLCLQVAYLSFRLVATLTLDTWSDGVLSVAFFLSELFIHCRIALGNLSLLCLSDRSSEADESQRAVRRGEVLPTVDVFVPTYSEPVEMLRRTIIGCQAMEYAHKTIYLLDDQRRPAMRQLALELGCQYLDRPDNRHAKAGNLNHALPQTRGQLILCFDADFVPLRNFLQRTVGFFRDPAVALVQTPQNFFNEDAVTRNLGLEHALEDEQRLFFRTIQPGRDSANAIVCHGSCFVVRRSALEAIGGVPTETITEDWATSIRLQAAGYKLLYLNEALSAGMAADRIGEFVQQRSRWAQGTLQALFASTNPLTVPGLSWKQRLLHFSGIIYYLGSLSSLFNLIAPLFYLFFGAHLLRLTVTEMLFYRLPFAVGFYLLYSWLTGRTRSALWTEFYEAFLAPSLALTVVQTLWRPFGKGFRVTDKVIRRQQLCLNRCVALPFAILLILHILGFFFALAVHRSWEDQQGFAIVTYFVITNLITLWVCLLVSLDISQESQFVRFEHQLPCRVSWNTDSVPARTSTVSEGGVVLRWPNRLPPENLPNHATLSLPDLELWDLPVTVRAADSQVSLDFVQLTLQQQRVLVAYLYCRPGQWDRPPRGELRAWWEYLRAGLRIYPLAESA